MKNELKYAKILESAGFTREQAESHLRVIEGAMLDNVATKQDIEKLQLEAAGLRSELKSDLAEIRADFSILRSEVNSLEHRLINKVGVMIVTASAAITAISGGVAALLKFAF